MNRRTRSRVSQGYTTAPMLKHRPPENPDVEIVEAEQVQKPIEYHPAVLIAMMAGLTIMIMLAGVGVRALITPIHVVIDLSQVQSTLNADELAIPLSVLELPASLQHKLKQAGFKEIADLAEMDRPSLIKKGLTGKEIDLLVGEIKKLVGKDGKTQLPARGRSGITL